MSNTVMPGEEASWAQTFITVTPHEDGFLREIDENVVVSGSGDTPVQLDTWNIVLRRSLVNTTKDWIDSSELEQSKRVETECQTYLQGVPKVELPRVYRDEATQTLYIGRDGKATTTPIEYFDDIITVLNEECLPQQKTSQSTQTAITMRNITSEADIVTLLIADSDLIANESESSIDTTDKESAFMEAEDILNFVVERTLWMSKSLSACKKEKKDANVQTSMIYNHRTKKLTIDYEVQTELSCEPKYSNSMLLADYNETKKFCRDRIIKCLEYGVYSRIDIDNIIDEMITRCKRQMNFSSEEKVAIAVDESASNVKNFTSSLKNNEEEKVETTSGRKLISRPTSCKCTIKSEVNRITRPIRDAFFTENRSYRRNNFYRFQSNPKRCENGSLRSGSTSESIECTSSSGSSERSSSSLRSLPAQDVQALGALKNAFSSRDHAELEEKK